MLVVEVLVVGLEIITLLDLVGLAVVVEAEVHPFLAHKMEHMQLVVEEVVVHSKQPTVVPVS